MATHGTIGEFQNAQESWQSYVERLQYFVANDVKTADKQHAVLLSTVGGQTYQLIRNLLAPTKPTEVTFAEIVDAVQKHVQPRPSIIVERFNFHSRARRQGEDVSTYVAELRKLSEHCNFGTALNDMLRDRLVCGIADQRIQRRLLAEPDLTFAKALELAHADRNTRALDRGHSLFRYTKSEEKQNAHKNMPAKEVGLGNCIATVVVGSTNRSSAISGTVTATTVGRKDI